MNIVILGDRYRKGNKNQGCIGLIKINKSTNLLQQQYKSIRTSFDNANIYYVYGFEYKKFGMYVQNNKYDICYIYNQHYEKLNEGFSIANIIPKLDEGTLIIDGSNILSAKAFANFDSEVSQVFIDKTNKSNIGCIINHNVVENIFYDLNTSIHNMFYVSQKDLPILKNELMNPKTHNMFLFEIMNNCINNGVNFKATKIPSNGISQHKLLIRK
jgi:CTP:phosphocholine cytidylyltransferase-like protein